MSVSNELIAVCAPSRLKRLVSDSGRLSLVVGSIPKVIWSLVVLLAQRSGLLNRLNLDQPVRFCQYPSQSNRSGRYGWLDHKGKATHHH